MRTWLLLLLSLTLVSAETEGKLKSQELRRLGSQSPDGIIKLTPSDFFKYVMEFPRPYDFVIYFTANKCAFCEEMQVEFSKTSNFYKEAGALFPVKEENKQMRAVFFGIVTFTEDFRQIFQELEFKNVPHLVVFQPKTAILSKDERQVYLKRFRWSITHTDGHVTTHKMLEYVNKHTGREIEYKPTLMDAVTVIGLLVGTGLILLALFVLFKSFFLDTRVWFVGSITIYVICCAGLVYNIIHNIPMTSTNKNGETEWFSSQNRSQLGAEGFIMSGLFVFVGLLMISWHWLYKKITDKMFLRVLYLMIFALVYIVVKFIEDIYTKKGWYNPRFWPPENYVKGPLMRDQGNNI